MINKHNYKDIVAKIKYTELPQALSMVYDEIKNQTNGYTDWSIYDSEPDVKELFDMYFKRIGELYGYLLEQKGKAQPTLKIDTAIHEKKVTKKTDEVKSKKTIKNTQPKKPSKAKVVIQPNASYVEHLPDEIKLIKRYVNLDGKGKTSEDIYRFIQTLQKSIVEKKVSKKSPYAKHIMYIQNNLIETYNTMGKTIDFKIVPKKFDELMKSLGKEVVYPSVPFLKRYVSLIGKYDVRDKAQLLLKQIEKAVKNGSIVKADKYKNELNAAYAKLLNYVGDKKQKTIEIQQRALNGLNGIIESCNCTSTSSLHGIDTVSPNYKPQIMNSVDFIKMKFNTIGFNGKWLEFIGDPTPNFKAMVSGRPKYGKSFLCVDFAGYLARQHGAVCYVANEEGLDYTLQNKLLQKDVAHPNLYVSSIIPKDLSRFQFVFFDSVNRLGLTPEYLTNLYAKYPNTAFISIFQVTKDGAFRGSNTFQHDVDIIIDVPEKGKAVQMGRFNQGSHLSIF